MQVSGLVIMSENGKYDLSLLPASVQTCSNAEMSKLVRLSGLSEQWKRVAWSEINTNSPELANLLKEPDLKQIVQMFDADIFVDADLVPSLPQERLKGRH